MSLIPASMAAERRTLRGVGVFESTEFDGLNRGVSMAGGGTITISGQGGLSAQPAENQVVISTTDVSSTNLDLSGTPLTEDDEFNSQSMNGKLVYTLPSMS